MKIDEAWERIVGADAPFMVLAYPEQRKARKFMQVAVIEIKSDEDFRRKESRSYDRIIGVYDNRISRKEFRQDCEAICKRNRAIEGEVESLLRSLGGGVDEVGLSSDESLARILATGEGGSSDSGI